MHLVTGKTDGVKIFEISRTCDVIISYHPNPIEPAMRPMRFFVFLALTASLTGCIRASNLYLEDGSRAHEIDCDSRWTTLENCFEKAAETCGANGFETVTREGISTGRMVEKGSTDINAGAFSTRTILVRCNNDRPVPKY